MTANLPVPRDPNLPRIADIIPLPVQRPGRIQRAITAFLQDPSQTPLTDSLNETIDRLVALRDSIQAQETITARRRMRWFR